jgi:XRE family aerobic/anaerobic benzoate catabolism transcriptional regulator
MAANHPCGSDQLLARLGARVRMARLLRSWSLRQLAQRTALSERFLGKLEAGRGNISVRNLAQVAEALDTSPAKLLGDDGAKSLPPVIALLGVRGAGKTCIGQRLARRFKVPFIELDRCVEDAAGLRVREILAMRGEDHLRTLERRALQRVLAEDRRCVLAVGDGLVTDSETWALLRTRAFTMWLRAAPRNAVERSLARGDRQQMTRSAATHESQRLQREREPLYALAHVTIDTSSVGLADAFRAALQALN